MKIYIGLSQPTGKFAPFADLIKWVEARPYDHCYVRLQEPMNAQYVIFQASKSQVNVYNKDIWQKSNAPFKEYEIEITEDQYKVLWTFVIKNLGIPYSLKEDFGILLMKIFKLKTNPFDAGMSVAFCSQLGATVCKNLGIDIPYEASSVDPSLLDQLLINAKLPMIMFPKF